MLQYQLVFPTAAPSSALTKVHHCTIVLSHLLDVFDFTAHGLHFYIIILPKDMISLLKTIILNLLNGNVILFNVNVII